MARCEIPARVDYESLKKINKRLSMRPSRVLARTGIRDRPGFDQIAREWRPDVDHRITRARTGAGRHTGRRPDRRIFAAMGILIALLEREQSGRAVGHKLPARAQIAMLDFQAARWTIAHEVRVRPATIIRPASRPGCSRPPTHINIAAPATTSTNVAAGRWACRNWLMISSPPATRGRKIVTL